MAFQFLLHHCMLRKNVLSGKGQFNKVGVPDNISQDLPYCLKQQNLATYPVLVVVQKLQASLDESWRT